MCKYWRKTEKRNKSCATILTVRMKMNQHLVRIERANGKRRPSSVPLIQKDRPRCGPALINRNEIAAERSIGVQIIEGEVNISRRRTVQIPVAIDVIRIVVGVIWASEIEISPIFTTANWTF